jgi:hypothetical protein
MKTLDEDPRLKEPHRLPARKKEKPRHEKIKGPFNYQRAIDHFNRYSYSKTWISDLKAILELLGDNVPFRKRKYFGVYEDIHVWVTKCLNISFQRNIITEEDRDQMMSTMDSERVKAFNRLEKRLRFLPEWRRRPQELNRMVNNGR